MSMTGYKNMPKLIWLCYMVEIFNFWFWFEIVVQSFNSHHSFKVMLNACNFHFYTKWKYIMWTCVLYCSEIPYTEYKLVPLSSMFYIFLPMAHQGKAWSINWLAGADASWQIRSIQCCTQTLPCSCQVHTDDTWWMTGRGEFCFPLAATLSDFQDRLFRVFLIFLLFRTDGNSVHAENLCTTIKMGIHAMGVNVFCPNRNICWRQESLLCL